MVQFLTSLFVLCAILAAQALGAGTGDWSKTCSDASVSLGELRANCNTPPMGPPWICSELDLNKCYAFKVGEGIYEKDGGNFGEHCEGCELGDDGVTNTMRCQCPGRDGKPQSYYIDTDILIQNDEGYLLCFHHIGNKCEPDKRAVGTRHNLVFTA